jgi:outer membrane protein
MATTDADALKREIDALDRSIKRNREAMRNDLKSRSDQELDKSWREINDAVVAFAREQGYDIVVPSPVVYASARVDITDQVLDRLRKQFRDKPAGATP